MCRCYIARDIDCIYILIGIDGFCDCKNSVTYLATHFYKGESKGLSSYVLPVNLYIIAIMNIPLSSEDKLS